MSSKLLFQGAEAKIFLDSKKDIVIKDRIKKSYRIKEIDERIRKLRTRSETKLLEKASKIINCPKPIPEKDFDKIKIQFINGKKLSEFLDKFSLEIQKQLLKKIGEDVAKLHDVEIIHGDLTTSNMILKGNNVFFIDFGLGFISAKIEDKAVDIHLLKQALEAKHFKHWKILFEKFIDGYKNSKDSGKVILQLEKVEKRRRYRF